MMFFMMIALLFLVEGIILMKIVMQVVGVVVLVFVLYNLIFNSAENKMYRNNPVRKFHFMFFLGNVDLVLGILLILKSFYDIVPTGLIFFFAIMLVLKALPFIFGGDIASIFDVFIVVIILFLGVAEIPFIILILLSVYLIQKGIFSFFY